MVGRARRSRPVRGAPRLPPRYGEGPLHLLLMLASFALAGYAGVRLLAGGQGPWCGLVRRGGAAARSGAAAAVRARRPRAGPLTAARAAGSRARTGYVRVPAFAVRAAAAGVVPADRGAAARRRRTTRPRDAAARRMCSCAAGCCSRPGCSRCPRCGCWAVTVLSCRSRGGGPRRRRESESVTQRQRRRSRTAPARDGPLLDRGQPAARAYRSSAGVPTRAHGKASPGADRPLGPGVRPSTRTSDLFVDVRRERSPRSADRRRPTSSAMRVSRAPGSPPMPMLPSRSRAVPQRPSPGRESKTERLQRGAAGRRRCAPPRPR